MQAVLAAGETVIGVIVGRGAETYSVDVGASMKAMCVKYDIIN